MSIRALRAFAAAAVLTAVTSCGDVVRDGRSPAFVVIDSMGGARGNTPGSFAGILQSDVLTLITSGGSCSQTSPCPTIFNDVGQASFRLVLKDIGSPASPNAPTTNNEVTLTRYHVSYRRADGLNTQGVDVPYGFDGAATVTVPQSGSVTMTFELVRNVAKAEAPLAQLVTNRSVITTIADVTFFGRDRVGNDVNVTGSIQVDFGNFGD
jgi:hypothetical protein